MDEAYHLLKDMVEYDNWRLAYLINNQSWENDLNLIEPWVDIQPHENMVALEEF